MTKAGYASAEEFAAEVARGYEEIWLRTAGTEEQTGRLVLLVRRRGPSGLGVIELVSRRRGDYYDIVSAYPIREGRKVRGELLWSASETAASLPGPLGTPWGEPGGGAGSRAAGAVRTGPEQPASLQNIPPEGSPVKGPGLGRLPGWEHAAAVLTDLKR